MNDHTHFMLRYGSGKHIKKHIDDGEYLDLKSKVAILKNHDAPTEVVDKLSRDDNSAVGRMAIGHHNLSRARLDELEGSGEHAVLSNPSISSDTLYKHIKTVSHMEHIVKNPALTKHHIDTIIDHAPTWRTIDGLATHKNFDNEHIAKILNSEHHDRGVKTAALESPNVSSANLHTALKDEDEEVRYSAITHPNATLEHAKVAQDDEHSAIRAPAKRIITAHEGKK